MTPKQTSLYWRRWALARAALRLGGMTPEQADDERSAATVRALGRPVSSKLFGNSDLDKMLAEFGRIERGERFASHLPDLDTEEGDKRRILHELERFSKPHGGTVYWHAIARDQFVWTDPAILTSGQLMCLLYTVRANTRSKERREVGEKVLRPMRPGYPRERAWAEKNPNKESPRPARQQSRPAAASQSSRAEEIETPF